MFNLVKMDLYRMVHSVSFKVMLFVVAAVAFFTIGMTSYDVKNSQASHHPPVWLHWAASGS